MDNVAALRNYEVNLNSQLTQLTVYGKIEIFFQRFQDLTVDQFREIRAKAGGVIILLPEDMSLLSSEEKQVHPLINSL